MVLYIAHLFVVSDGEIQKSKKGDRTMWFVLLLGSKDLYLDHIDIRIARKEDKIDKSHCQQHSTQEFLQYKGITTDSR